MMSNGFDSFFICRPFLTIEPSIDWGSQEPVRIHALQILTICISHKVLTSERYDFVMMM
jgi:hypothetical protein